MTNHPNTWFLLAALLMLVSGCSKEEPAIPSATSNKASPTMNSLATKSASPTPFSVPPATETAFPEKTLTPGPIEPESTPTIIEEITFHSGSFKLVGDLQLPAFAGVHPAIIMVHGDGDIDRTCSGIYNPIMDRFLNAGYAVFSWDKPGTGGSTGELAGNSDVIFQRASILVHAVDTLAQHPAIDPEQIGVWGISQAGYVMPLALTMTDKISFMIVTSGPAMDTHDQGAYRLGQVAFCAGASQEEADFIEQYASTAAKATTYQQYRQSTLALLDHPQYPNLGISLKLESEADWEPKNRERLDFFNPIVVIEQASVPILAIFGENDRQVDPFQGAQNYQDAFLKTGIQESRVEVFPDADHNIILSETGCLDERANRSGSAWQNYAPGYLASMGEWLEMLNESHTVYHLPQQGETNMADLQDRLQITIVYDNILYDERLRAEWGFAALVTYKDHVLLFDTGGSATLMRNMHLLGIDPKSIEAVVISHKHGDHTGGLDSFLAEANQPTVYLPASFHASFKNSVAASTRVVEVSRPIEIFPDIYTTGEVYNDVIEQALAIRTDGGAVIITGCAHPGIARMVQRGISSLGYEEGLDDPGIALVVGGFHMSQLDTDQIERVIADLQSLHVQQVCPTHCTGNTAIAMFAKTFGENYIQGGVGKVITLP